MCDKSDGSCFCKPGFRGAGCNNPTNEAVSTCECGLARAVRLASGALMQVCTGRLEGGTCACREGWTGATCSSYCPGAGPPALQAAPGSPGASLCGGRGTCPPTAGSDSATCACDSGYAPLGVGGVCVPMTCAAGNCPAGRGRTVQVDSTNTRVESASGVCNQRLKLQYIVPLSNCSFNCNLRCYDAARAR
jgi:hypothetical protein